MWCDLELDLHSSFFIIMGGLQHNHFLLDFCISFYHKFIFFIVPVSFSDVLKQQTAKFIFFYFYLTNEISHFQVNYIMQLSVH